VNIEEVAATEPSAIVTVPIDVEKGITPEIAGDMAEKMGFKVSSIIWWWVWLKQ